jgi:hypothetical protein
MKGKRPSFGWVKDSELEEGWIAASPNGWTDNKLGRNWIEKIFDPCTREKCVFAIQVCCQFFDRANGAWRCIVLDNHGSHISLEFIDYAWNHKIIIVLLPPKTSGKTQPLDVACFREYQKAYGRAADEEVQGGVAISKQDFPW